MLPLERLPSIENNDDTQSIDYNSTAAVAVVAAATDTTDEWKKVKSLSFIQNNREQLVTVQVICAY